MKTPPPPLLPRCLRCRRCLRADHTEALPTASKDEKGEQRVMKRWKVPIRLEEDLLGAYVEYRDAVRAVEEVHQSYGCNCII